MPEILFTTAAPHDQTALEAFLRLAYGDDYAELIHSYARCAFSQDFRRPTFVLGKMDCVGEMG